ncbi:RHS repeat domain-containing protein [Sorangium sp. So ce1128]
MVTDIAYNARGQRERIEYGNGVATDYTYDPLTFRLRRIRTVRASGNAVLQDLGYTHDPVGNIVEIEDRAQRTVHHNDQVVEPVNRYEYDALYRLTRADGREHAGQNADVQQDERGFPLVNAPHPNDPQALRNYTERYEYDDVGNILAMIHQAGSGSWTRRYEVARENNRLLSTSLPRDPEAGPYSAKYGHDAHGNMTSMPHLSRLVWDEKDQMREVDLGGGGKVYFVYDAAGERVRKVWEHSGIVEERVYLGGYEVYWRREGAVQELVLERQTLHVMDGARRIALVEIKTVDTSGPFTVNPRVRYQLDNHLGSASLELDEDGAVISYEEYHPLGSSAYRATGAGVEVSTKRYRYCGAERDDETGLYCCGLRHYAPWLGRWTAADPHGLVDGVNLYAYVSNNPVRLRDPTGTQGQPHDIPVRVRPQGVPSDVGRWAYSPHGAGIVTGSTGEFAQKTKGLQVFVFDPNAPEANTATMKKAAALHEADVLAGKLAEALKPSGGADGGSAWSPWEQFAQGNQATQELALAAGLANLALDEDIKPRDGSSPHGIVGGRNEGAEATPVQQAAASVVQLAAALAAQAIVKAIRKATALSKTLMLPPKPVSVGTSGLSVPKVGPLTAGKNFREHFVSHRAAVENALGVKFGKLKDGGGEALLKALSDGIENGTFKYVGQGTLKKGAEAMSIYRGRGLTIVVKNSGEWVTALKSGEGMDLAIRVLQ